MNSTERKQQRYLRRKHNREEKRKSQNEKYNDFNNLTNPINLLTSFKLCRKGVSWKHSVQFYELNLIRNINDAVKSLKKGILPSKGFEQFQINERGKIRSIKSPHISERVVQKTLCDQCLTPILNKPLIYDNGASLKNKGTSFTRKRMITHLSKYYRQYGKHGYVLLIDYSKYFDSIDHKSLFYMADRYITNPQTRNIYHQAVNEFGDTGLGLGSQISQTLAIFFPNRIDHYIKEVLHIKYYGRYMDDSYLISSDKKYLEYCLDKIEELCEKQKIIINKKKTKIVKLTDGFTFMHCKYRYTNSGSILKNGGRESAVRMRRKLRFFRERLDIGKMTIKEIRDVYQGWRGFMRQFDNRNIMQNIDAFYNELFVKRII